MTTEIIATAGFTLLALSVAAYLLHRQCVTIERQANALDVYKHALDDERKAHAKTHARLIEAQQIYKEECL